MVLGLSSVFAGSPLRGYTEAMFRRAMARDNIAVSGNLSSSPLYVLITVRDAKTNGEREVCILGTALTEGIREERHLPRLGDGKDPFEGARMAYKIAISAPSRVFQFKSQRARKLVAPAYTIQQLSEVRRLIEGKSLGQLRKEAKVDLFKPPDQQSSLTKIYRHETRNGFLSSDSYRVAVAHVLLEHGILVGEAHDTATLYVEE
jgi:hypothetical protein